MKVAEKAIRAHLKNVHKMGFIYRRNKAKQLCADIKEFGLDTLTRIHKPDFTQAQLIAILRLAYSEKGREVGATRVRQRARALGAKQDPSNLPSEESGGRETPPGTDKASSGDMEFKIPQTRKTDGKVPDGSDQG